MEYNCTRCKLLLPADAFPKDPRNTKRDGLSTWCRKCKTEDQRERYARDPEKARERVRKSRNRDPTYTRKRHLRNMYGMTPDQHAELLMQQGGGCAICGATEAGGKTGAWHTDHCHDSKKVRGILCAGCNVGLGHFRDDPTRLQFAIDYLKRAR